MHRGNFIPKTNGFVYFDEGELKYIYREIFKKDTDCSLLAIKMVLGELGYAVGIENAKLNAENCTSFEDWKERCEDDAAKNTEE